MRPSVFNPGLMADFKRESMPVKLEEMLTGEEQVFDECNALEMHGAMHQGIDEAFQNIDKHKKLAELMPEPAGGYRANLITFSIRYHVLEVDKRPDFRQMLAVEKAYFGINQMSFAAGRQTGKSESAAGTVRQFLGNWLNYIEQAVSKGA